ncbi:chorismate lyase [Escherichia coli]|nr:chorismate lyase [Escherichia coli]
MLILQQLVRLRRTFFFLLYYCCVLLRISSLNLLYISRKYFSAIQCLYVM